MFKMTDSMSKIVQLQRTWLAKCDLASVPERYFKSCLADFDSIQKAIPRRSAGQINILDIGAGMGGIDVLLYHYYNEMGVSPRIHALDKDNVDASIRYGYSAKPSAYNQRVRTTKFFLLNGIPPEHMASITEYPALTKFDLVISLISCGFHYPVSAYLKAIENTIHPKTVLIFDIRKKSGQFDQLHDTFNWVNCLQITEKYKRVVCRL